MSTAAYVLCCAIVSLAILALADYMWQWLAENVARRATATSHKDQRNLTKSLHEKARLGELADTLLREKGTEEQ
jgi:hypothetical protein